MKTLIYLEDAIDAIKKHYRAHDNDLLELIAYELERLPSAEPEQRWVPVSERLPEPNTCCLVTTEDGYVDMDDYYIYGWDDNGDTVIAWQPLPEPWAERRTDNVDVVD